MKRVLFSLLFFNACVLVLAQSGCNIKSLEIYACDYGTFFYIHPSIEDIKSDIGQYIKISNYSDICNSDLEIKLEELEKYSSELYTTDEAEWTSRAIVTIQYEDSTRATENLYIMSRGIVWKNRRYESYYPLIESVYYFYPDRYFDADYYRNYHNHINEE